MKERGNYRPDIDGLRAVAVLAVLFFHVDSTLFSGGYVGVDVFFVISGYLITRNIVSDVARGKWSFRSFYIRRWRRLFPASIFTLAISFVFAALLLSTWGLVRFSESLLYALAYLSNVFFWLESGYFDVDAGTKPLLHMWSLAVEEQFYIVWPATIVLLLRFKRSRYLPVALIGIGVASLALGAAMIERHPSAVFFLLPFRMSEFVFGAMLLWLPAVSQARWGRLCQEFLLFIGLLLIGYAATQYTQTTVFPGLNAIIPCLGAAMVIYAGEARWLGFCLRNRLAVFIGLISYSVYLVHWPLIVFYNFWSSQPMDGITQGLVILASLGLGVILFRCIEQPFRVAGKASHRLGSRGFLLGSLGAIVVLALTAWHAKSSGGWAWRITPLPVSEAARGELSVERSVCSKKRVYIKGCIIGETSKEGPANLILIGDSHAMALEGAFDYIGKNSDLKVKLHALISCPPIFSTDESYIWSTLKNTEDLCANNQQRWKEEILTSPAEFVVLAARWSMYIARSQAMKNRDDAERTLIDEEHSVPISSEANELIAYHLEKTVQELLDGGKKVLLVGQVPELNAHPWACHTPRYLFSDPYGALHRCNASYEDVRKRKNGTDAAIRTIGARHPDVLSIITSDYFCNEVRRECTFNYQGLSLYKDDNHLSEVGSIYVAKQFEGAVIDFVASKGK